MDCSLPSMQVFMMRTWLQFSSFLLNFFSTPIPRHCCVHSHTFVFVQFFSRAAASPTIHRKGTNVVGCHRIVWRQLIVDISFLLLMWHRGFLALICFTSQIAGWLGCTFLYFNFFFSQAVLPLRKKKKRKAAVYIEGTPVCLVRVMSRYVG